MTAHATPRRFAARRRLLGRAAAGALGCWAMARSVAQPTPEAPTPTLPKAPLPATAAPRLAILSLIGDRLDVVTFQQSTGSSINQNRHELIALSDAVFDRAALAAAAASTRSLDPDPRLLLVNDAAAYEHQADLLADGKLHLPANVLASVKATGADRLALISKLRGEAHLRIDEGLIGEGQIEGLGFYLNNQTWLRRSDTNEAGRGFIAPFFYANVSMIDLSTLAVLATTPIREAYALSAARNKAGVDPWGTLSEAQKIDALRGLIRRHVPVALEKLAAQLRRS